MRSFIASLFLLTLIPSASAQFTTNGRVMDQEGLPIAFVHVRILDGELGTITDGQGNFDLELPGNGPYQIELSAVGFATTPHTVRATDSIQVIRMDHSAVDLPQFTVNGSMTNGDEGARERGGSAWYIGPKDIHEFSYTDVNRLLRSVPGVNIQEEDGFGLRPNIGLRGTGSERSEKITLMEDGVLIAPAPYSAPAAYYFPTFGRMNAVEVIKGSSQIQFGPLTTGGAIDLLSTPIPSTTHGSLSLHAGSFGMRDMHATAGTTKGQLGVLVESFLQANDGFKELDDGGSTGFEKQDHLVKVRIKNKQDAKMPQALTLKVNTTRERSNETYLGLTADDLNKTPLRRYSGSQKDRMEMDHDLFTLGYQIKPSQKTELSLTLYRTNTARNWYKLDKVVTDGGSVGIAALLESPSRYADAYNTITDDGSESDILLVKANNRHYQSSGVAMVGKVDLSGENSKHQLEFGVRVHRDHMDRFQWVDGYSMQNGMMFQVSQGVRGTESNRFQQADAIASHLVHEWTKKQWKLRAGARYEHIELRKDDYGTSDPFRTGNTLNVSRNQVNVLIPGASVLRELGKGWNTFIGVHQGFAPPSTAANSMPERSMNYEGGIRHSGLFELQLIGFLNDYSELLGSDLVAAGGDGSGEVFNAGKAQVSGIELSVEHELLNGRMPRIRLPLRVNYTFTDARFGNTFSSDYEPWAAVVAGDRIPYTPLHQLNMFIGMQLKEWTVNTTTSFIGSMSATTAPTENTAFASIPSHWVTDVNLMHKLTGKITLSMGATNLFDNMYVAASRPAGLRPGAPRMLRVGYEQRF